MNNDLQKVIWAQILSKASEFVNQANDSYLWAKNFLGVELYSNQIEVLNAVCDPKNEYVVVLGSRGCGKTFSTCVGLIRLAIDLPGHEIGIFGPRTDQAARLITESKKILTNSKLYDKVDWVRTTAEKLIFKNNSSMLALSAAETSLQEGWHFETICLDEAHRASSIAVSQRILPMLGSKKHFKFIKIGIPLFKNHFFESYSDPKYKVIQHDWLQSPILLESGITEIEGKKYPTKVLDRMPRSLKTKMFPDNTELHSDGDMTEIEFNTQYGMKWMDDVNTFLSADDLGKLIGESPILKHAQAGDLYYFGLDTSAGTLMPGKYDLDFTALSIWRKTSTGLKEKVLAVEWQGGESLSHFEEIISLIHPSYGKFPCTFGCVDYSNVGITAVELFKREKIPVAGVLFSATEPDSHKNYKNAMANQFKFELQAGRIKYPRMEDIEVDKVMRKHYHQWMAFECHAGLGLNSRLTAPDNLHDDGVCADLLSCYAADRSSSFRKGMMPVHIPSTSIARSIMSSRPGDNQGKKYL